MRFLKQSTSVDLPIGPFLDATDGITAESGLTLTQPDIRLKKNGGAWAQKAAAQTLSHEENGYYEVTLDATDTDTLGCLRLAVAESGAVPIFEDFMVVPANIWDSWFASALQSVNATQISGDSGAADNLELAFEDSARYIRKATAQAGDTSEITLDASASAVDDFYNGTLLHIVGGTGVNQARIITGYIGATKVATVGEAWGTNPSSDSVFIIIPGGNAAADVNVTQWNGAAVATPSVAGVPEVDLTHVGGATTNVAALATNVDAILTDTGTTLQNELDGIQADTEDIQSRIPSALVSGRIDASIGAVAANALTASGLAADAVDEILDEQLTDSIPADGTLPTVRQALYMITQFLLERGVSSTTVTVNKVDGTTPLFTLTLDDATNPTSITRAT